MHIHSGSWGNIAVMCKLCSHINTFMYDIFFFSLTVEGFTF